METTASKWMPACSGPPPGRWCGHPVQDVAVLAVGLGQPLGDDADDDLIGNQLAGVHIFLGLQSHRRAVGHGGPEDVAGEMVGNVQLVLMISA